MENSNLDSAAEEKEATAEVLAAVSMVENSKSTPNGPILFYDGECALCHRAVRRLIRWERKGHRILQFAPLNGATAELLRTEGLLLQGRDAVVLWTPTSMLIGEAATGAALELIGHQGWARAFRALPGALRRGGYRITARQRNRWFGKVPATCPMPSSPHRFLP